jgi:hypothetical protein
VRLRFEIYRTTLLVDLRALYDDGADTASDELGKTVLASLTLQDLGLNYSSSPRVRLRVRVRVSAVFLRCSLWRLDSVLGL